MPVHLLKVTPLQVARAAGAGRQRVLSPPVISSPPALGSGGKEGGQDVAWLLAGLWLDREDGPGAESRSQPAQVCMLTWRL